MALLFESILAAIWLHSFTSPVWKGSSISNRSTGCSHAPIKPSAILCFVVGVTLLLLVNFLFVHFSAAVYQQIKAEKKNPPQQLSKSTHYSTQDSQFTRLSLIYMKPIWFLSFFSASIGLLLYCLYLLSASVSVGLCSLAALWQFAFKSKINCLAPVSVMVVVAAVVVAAWHRISLAITEWA